MRCLYHAKVVPWGVTLEGLLTLSSASLPPASRSAPLAALLQMRQDLRRARMEVVGAQEVRAAPVCQEQCDSVIVLRQQKQKQRTLA